MANFPKLEVIFTGGSAIPYNTTLKFNTSNPSYPLIQETARFISTTGFFDRGNNAEQSAEGYRQALVRDFGFQYNISRDGITVTITADDYNEVFSGFSFPGITYNYTPGVEPTPVFQISSVTIQAADTEDRNTHMRINVGVSDGSSPYNITSPVTKNNQTEPLFFDYPRNPPPPLLPISITENGGETSSIPTTITADFWTLDSITVNESVSGATVIANTTTVSGNSATVKEYSLDNNTWQYGASFTGLLPGNYTMYVRDNLLALRTLPFEVVGVSLDKPEPYFDIVNSNTLRFVPDITFGCGDIPNWDNALFQKILDEQFPNVERRHYNQPISDCDDIVTQIRTTYDNITVNVTDCEGNLVIQPEVTLRRENIQKKDKRDCTIKKVDTGQYAGKVFLYFTGGRIYTPDTNTVIGTYVNGSKGVFPFAKKGELFSIANTSSLNGDYEQLDIIFDASSGFYGVVLDVSFSGSSVQSCRVQTLYNEQLYNVWEYTLVGQALDNDKIYNTEILATDPDVRYDDVRWIGEPVYKLSSTKNTVVFEASNGAENTANIDFTTGIKLRMRVEGRFIVSNITENNNVFETQQGNKVQLKSVVSTITPFESGLVPFYVVRKIAILSGLDELYINGKKYVKGEEAEAETLAGERNPFYKVRRDYQEDNSLVISESIGLVTQSPEVIGDTDTIVIGT